MELLLWIAAAALAFTVFILIIRINGIKKSAREIGCGLEEKLNVKTNTQIDVSGRDKDMRRLADTINGQLEKLYAERQRFILGDSELKNAVTNIAHDLRTPLTAISGYLQLLGDEEKSDNTEKYLALIENRTNALVELTEELFRYSVITAEHKLELTPVSLNDVLEECLISSYGPLKQRNIEPLIYITDIKTERVLDRSALCRVYENIITNAVKYSDGDLTVRLSDDGTAEFINSAKMLDSVSVGRLFDRFYTVETGRKSTGLGLSIAKQLTERMGGEIEAEYSDGSLRISVRFK